MKVYNFPQGSEEWKAIRKGKITGTKANKAFNSKTLDLIDELISEAVCDFEESDYQSEAMLWGVANEQFARQEYEKATFNKVVQYGFCVSDEFDYLGISPDGFIMENDVHIGGLEIKCPNPKTHCKYIRMGQVPAEYLDQVMHYFLINSEIKWVDFISYEPRNKVAKMFYIRTLRSEVIDDIENRKAMIIKFREKWMKYFNKFNELKERF